MSGWIGPPSGAPLSMEALEPRLLLSADSAVVSVSWAGQTHEAIDSQYVLRLAEPDDAEAIRSGLDALGAGGAEIEILSSKFALLTAPDATVEQVGAWADGLAEVAYFEPNFVLVTASQNLPNDPSLGSLWGLNNTGQSNGTVDADIDAAEAWTVHTGSDNVVVAVIDTGIDYTHPDLAANMWRNPGEVAGDGVDNDGNGYIDDVYGWDFCNDDSNPMDDNGHGTHVAGTIGASGNNATGVVGVNWNVKLMALKFLSGSGSGSTADAVRAIEYATMMKTQYGVNVVVTNNSWGGGGYSTALYDAIAAGGQAGILFAAAAGNGGYDGVGDNNDAYASYPASYDLDCIIAVAATDRSDRLASFSNYGATTVDLSAPGVSIYSTLPGNRYGSYSGTSMATPHVAGAVALLAASDPSAQPLQIKAALLNHVDAIDAMDGRCVTGGRLNVHHALLGLAGTPVPEPDPEPEPLPAPAENNNTLATAVATGLTDAGEYSARGYIGDSSYAADVDLFYVTVHGPAQLVIEAIGDGEGWRGTDTMVRLFDTWGNQLAWNDDRAWLDYDSYLVYDLQAAGRYYVGVSGYSDRYYDPEDPTSAYLGSTGAYTLNLTLTEQGPPSGSHGDFTGDGKADILWRNLQTGQNAIWVMGGTSYVTGCWLPTVGDSNWRMVGMGQFNDDGKSDIIWRNVATGENAVWYLDDGVYSAADWLPSEADTDWTISAAADFDGDGDGDILWRNRVTGANRIWRMDGANLETTVALPAETDLAWQLADAADFDKDDDPDLLWRNRATGENRLWMMAGENYGSTWALAAAPSLEWQIGQAGDFDGDGDADIIWRNEADGGVGVWLMETMSIQYSGQLSPCVSLLDWKMVSQRDWGASVRASVDGEELPAGQAVDCGATLAGRTGDGCTITIANVGTLAMDLGQAVASAGFEIVTHLPATLAPGESAELVVRLTGAGAGAQTGTVRFATSDPAHSTMTLELAGSVTAAGDLTGDARADVIWWNAATGQAAVWSVSDGAYAGSDWLNTVSDTGWRPATTGEFSGDAWTDIVWQNAGTGQVALWRMNGSSLAGAAWLPTEADTDWRIVGAGDFNADGASDLVWRNRRTGENRVWIMDGESVESTIALQAEADAAWQLAGTGDFNADGQADLVWRHRLTGADRVWLMDGTSVSASAALPARADLRWQIGGVGDFDADGDADLIWRNEATGATSVWLMDGVSLASESEALPAVGDLNWEMVLQGDWGPTTGVYQGGSRLRTGQSQPLVLAAESGREISLTVRNDGTAPLAVWPATVTAGFEIVGANLPGVLQIGQSASLTVRAVSGGTLSGSLSFASADPRCPQFTVALQAEAGAAATGFALADRPMEASPARTDLLAAASRPARAIAGRADRADSEGAAETVESTTAGEATETADSSVARGGDLARVDLLAGRRVQAPARTAGQADRARRAGQDAARPRALTRTLDATDVEAVEDILAERAVLAGALATA